MRLLPNDRTVHDFIFKQQDNGHKLPPEMDAFLEEYVAARNIGMTPAQARRLAERRYRKEAGVG